MTISVLRTENTLGKRCSLGGMETASLHDWFQGMRRSKVPVKTLVNDSGDAGPQSSSVLATHFCSESLFVCMFSRNEPKIIIKREVTKNT